MVIDVSASEAEDHSPSLIRGPFFDELAVGQVFDTAPSLTLSNGHAVLHQGIVGDRLRLPLDDGLAHEVTGHAPLAHPALVWDVAIGQSTLATQKVLANLFYRGLLFRRYPFVGDTLSTTTEVAGLRQNRSKPGRHPTGLAVLRVRTVDQEERPVLDFWRCAMLPLSDPEGQTGHDDDLDTVGVRPAPQDFVTAAETAVEKWRLARFRERARGGEHFNDIKPGRRWSVVGADVVSSAPELARLTLNIASVHHDLIAAGGQRLVYGGHTIGIALAQVSRALPNVVTVAGWESCDHTGPVHEGDSLTSTVTAESIQPFPSDGGLVWLRVEVTAQAGPGQPVRSVLQWRCAVILA